MANTDNTPWGDLVEEKTPRQEKGWTDVKAPKGKKTKSRTKDAAPADPVAKKLDFGGKKPFSDPNNKFATLAEDSE